ncbi:MAG: patatin-like phospholipase family protein [Lautropia sp.]
MTHHRRPLRLALQGGGALGAYTWGVLDALLASRSVALTHFSGTSAGALNAAVCASAIARGGPSAGRREARRALASFWQAISSSPWTDYVGLLWGPVARSMRKGFGEWLWANALASPYARHILPAMTSTPLAAVLEAHLDLDALRSPAAPRLFVTLTHVGTGLPRIFGNADLTLDVLLASACLPQVFRAVEIDGEAFWDGGYTGNPTLWPLVRHPGPADICLVQLSPGTVQATPVDVPQIRQRVGEIVFHSSLVAEMQAIQAIRESAAALRVENRFTRARFHRIGPPPDDMVGAGAAVDRSPRFLRALADAGRGAARGFLARDAKAIGSHETLEVSRYFVGGHKTRWTTDAALGQVAQDAGQGGPGPGARARTRARTDAAALAAAGVARRRPAFGHGARPGPAAESTAIE